MFRTTGFLAVFFFIFATTYAHNNGNGRNNYTGSAANHITCTDCHNSFSLNSGTGQLHVNNLPSGGYTPGQTYNLTITLQQSGLRIWGFQQTAVLSSNHNAKAGHLTGVNANANVSAGSGTQLDFANHTLTGNFGNTLNGPVTWNINWQAPAAGSGTVLFYTAGNAGNFNNTEFGDYIYNRVDTVREYIAPQPPSAFALLAPANNSPVADLPVLCQWQRSLSTIPGSQITYVLFRSFDSSPAIQDSVSVGTDTSFSWTSAIADSNYTWTVRADDGHGNHTFATQAFHFQYTPPQPPTGNIDLLQPQDNASIASESITFEWTGLMHPGGDDPIYTLWLKQGNDSASYNYGSATSALITLTNVPIFRWNEPLTWWVIGATLAPPTVVFSTTRFTLLPVNSVTNHESSPFTFALESAYPNPFNPSTTIRYSLPPNSGIVALKIYDESGRLVSTLYNGIVQSPGEHEARWNAAAFASGTYFVRLEYGHEVRIQRLMLIK